MSNVHSIGTGILFIDNCSNLCITLSDRPKEAIRENKILIY